ncbi:MAG: ROK family protein [Prosthecobacter sp.]|uniref:hypothetical protein n=1 Tax=Prosthecobacter sp. TaxID=1965333 RepID=UPI003BB04DDE
MPRITAQDLPPQDHSEDTHAPAPKPWENTTRSSGFDDAPPAAASPSTTRNNGFPPSPQDLRDDFHSPTPDTPTGKAPVQDNRPALPRGRIFEKRLPPGFRILGTSQSRNLSDIPGAPFQTMTAMTEAKSRPSNFDKNADIAYAAASPAPSRLGASAGVIAQQGAQTQQNQRAQPAPQGPGTTPGGGALQTANRVHLLDTTRPAQAPVKPENPSKPRQTNRSQKDDRIIKTPKDQFKAEMAAYERELAAHPEKMAAYEREKAAYEKALATADANQETNNRNQQTLKAWENYDHAIQMMENTPEGRKVLAHLRDNTTRVFKVIMVNDPARDSYRGITIKPGARGQYVNTGMKDEQGRDVHVIFLSAPSLARDAVTTGGKLNPDAEALEDVWHELYHASERQAGDAIDPLGIGTSHVNDRVDRKQWPNAHEKRAVRFENIIRKRNGGTRIKTKYGGGYYLNKKNERIEIPAIDVNDPVPPLAPIP